MYCIKRKGKEAFARGTIVGLLAAISVNTLAYSQESSTEVVAAAVRQQGYACDNPENAEPDANDTSPDEKAWILRCENGTYRVKFTGDTGAKVEPVSD